MKAFAKNRINLYKEYLRLNKQGAGLPPIRRIALLCVAVSAAAGLIVGGFFVLRRNALSASLSNLFAQSVSDEMISGKGRYNSVITENKRLSDYRELISNQTAPLYDSSRYSEYTPDLFDRLNSLCSGSISVEKISAEGYNLLLTFSSRSADEISEFVLTLRNSGLFSSVEYSGYTRMSSSYNFTLNCTIGNVGGAADE